jgi:hypothetical protein
LSGLILRSTRRLSGLLRKCREIAKEHRLIPH